jgi:hypothetical protein
MTRQSTRLFCTCNLTFNLASTFIQIHLFHSQPLRFNTDHLFDTLVVCLT